MYDVGCTMYACLMAFGIILLTYILHRISYINLLFQHFKFDHLDPGITYIQNVDLIITDDDAIL